MSVPGSNEALKKKALTWTIVGFLCGGVLPGVLGLIGYLKADTEPSTAATMTKWAKILTIIGIVLWVLVIAIYAIIVIVAVSSGAGSGTY